MVTQAEEIDMILEKAVLNKGWDCIIIVINIAMRQNTCSFSVTMNTVSILVNVFLWEFHKFGKWQRKTLYHLWCAKPNY